MTVYLVFEDASTWLSCSNGDFYGVFSTREKAQAFIDVHPDRKRQFPGLFGMVIEEHELDNPVSEQ
jgi:hypothetical protein